MRIKILALGLMVYFIVVFGTSALAFPQLQEVEWEDKGTASAVILGSSYDEVWEKVLDVLLFGKFKMKGGSRRSTHDATTVEKNTGLIVIKGVVGGFEYGGPMHSAVGGEYGKYILKVTIQEKDDSIVIKAQCNSAWKKEVIKKFFQLLEKEVKK